MASEEFKLEKLATAIASCMNCRLCPYPCLSTGESSMANCVLQWTNVMREAVLNKKGNEV